MHQDWQDKLQRLEDLTTKKEEEARKNPEVGQRWIVLTNKGEPFVIEIINDKPGWYSGGAGSILLARPPTDGLCRLAISEKTRVLGAYAPSMLHTLYTPENMSRCIDAAHRRAALMKLTDEDRKVLGL